MAIDRLFNADKRSGVAWLGVEPPVDARAAFEERGFRVNQSTPDELRQDAFVAGLTAIIFTQNPTKLAQITHELEENACRLLDYDCRIIIRAIVTPEVNGLSIIENTLKQLSIPFAGLKVEASSKLNDLQSRTTGEPPLPHVRVYSREDHWAVIANFLLEHQSGPAPNQSLRIEPDDVCAQLPADYQKLLRRAFWDCTEVHLRRMDDGKSGVSVYLAHPELAKGQIGRLAQWPLPYFLKIGDRGKVFKEFVNYEDHVDPYIPFHLGPHLIRERCCLGAHAGVIVGDFVEGSESLIDCARSGRAAPAIACLFNHTLSGWYRGAQENPLDSSQLGKSFVRQFQGMSKGVEARIERARQLGATKTLNELLTLIKKCESLPVLVGAIHGDLHAGNVRVRATDAIVIDFFAHQIGPLVYDAASLEASLFVDGFDDGERFVRNEMSEDAIQKLDIRIKEWMSSIEALYNHLPLRAMLMHPNPKSPSCWFHACVRQIRLFARQVEAGDNQYAAILAVALLRKATKDLKATEPEASRRAAAYVMAERVLLNTFHS